MADLSEVLAQRGGRYGMFINNATMSQAMKGAVRKGVNYDLLDPIHREALDMILHKVSRIVSGDPNYDDSWVDIAGYAQLVVDHIRTSTVVDKEETPKAKLKKLKKDIAQNSDIKNKSLMYALCKEIKNA